MKSRNMNFWRSQKGVAAIEFAFVFPFLFLLLFGGVEMARYILITQRVEKSAYVLTDIVGQETPATPLLNPSTPNPGEISVDRLQGATGYFSQFTKMMGVFGNPNRQGVIMSSVINTSSSFGTPNIRLRWQQYLAGSLIDGNGLFVSVVTGAHPTQTSGNACSGTAFDGDTTAILNSMTLGENMIVGEVFYYYTPIAHGILQGVTSVTPNFTGGTFNILQEQVIGRRLFLHPRNGELFDLPPAHPVQTDADGIAIRPCY